MRIKKSHIILTVFTLYGVNYVIFERIFFFNEVLSLIGLWIFFTNSIQSNYKFSIPRSTIYRMVLAFICLGLFYAIVSIPFRTNWYYYFRNLSIVYSTFSFFIGYFLYHQQFAFFSRARTAVYSYALAAFGLRWEGLIDRNAYSFWFALVQKDWKALSILGLISLYILYVLTYTSLTVIIILFCVVGVRYIRSYFQFKFIMASAIMAFAGILIWAIPYLKLYGSGDYNLFGNVELVYSQHPLFQLDKNSSWRLIFWYRTVIESFPANLLGVGIGTPILPYVPNITTTDLNFNDEYISHVIGTHNTYITIFCRMGIASILLLFIIYRRVFLDFYLFKSYYLTTRTDVGLFLSFVTISCVGLFNLVLESPTLASVYWVSLGFVAQAIEQRKAAFSKTR